MKTKQFNEAAKIRIMKAEANKNNGKIRKESFAAKVESLVDKQRNNP